MGNHWRAKGHRSRALGVHPSQAKKFTEAAQKEGIDVHYDSQTGDMVSNSRKARAQEALRRGFHDNDGGYLEDKYRTR
jgi:hypothetical protein